MADYRLYFLDHANHIRGVVEFACEDDAAAVDRAASHADGRRMELWSRDRLVRKFDRHTEPTSTPGGRASAPERPLRAL